MQGFHKMKSTGTRLHHINTDGAWEETTLEGGVGYIIRNEEGRCKVTTLAFINAPLVLVAELLAIKSALQHLYNQENLPQNIELETDFQVAANICNKPEMEQLVEARNIQREIIHFLIPKFTNIKIHYTTTNRAAHWLAWEKEQRHQPFGW